MTTWRGAGVVELACLENKCAFTGTEGSNPSLSAIEKVRSPPVVSDFFYNVECDSNA